MKLTKITPFVLNARPLLRSNKLTKIPLRFSSHGNSDFQRQSIVYTMLGAAITGIIGAYLLDHGLRK
ncbi:unnamed protein product [Brachionus calyciflorus]|uniref:Uncharacterized protein n=1 Tax=Brachionus calyciflorus TaxID=104777 RepID=A0A813WNZ9_9BILA|nr:unnamed protein product [Brachionus calyciflorus]